MKSFAAMLCVAVIAGCDSQPSQPVKSPPEETRATESANPPATPDEEGEVAEPSPVDGGASWRMERSRRFTNAGSHACYIDDGGDVWCAGPNMKGPDAQGKMSEAKTPHKVKGVSNAKLLTSGGRGICMVDSSGQVVCWGNVYGHRKFDNYAFKETPPTQVTHPVPASRIELGAFFGCILDKEGGLHCFGSNHRGELGQGHTKKQRHLEFPTAERVGLPGKVIDFSLSYWHACAVVESGEVYCWGKNVAGQLGNGTTNPSPVPSLVRGLENVVDVEVFGAQSCALQADGAAYCWGLHSPVFPDSVESQTCSVYKVESPCHLKPERNPYLGADEALGVGMGLGHTCRLTHDKRVECWGTIERRAMVDGIWEDLTVFTADEPTDMGLEGAVELYRGGQCARLEDDSIWCWGKSLEGVDNNGKDHSPTPVPFLRHDRSEP